MRDSVNARAALDGYLGDGRGGIWAVSREAAADRNCAAVKRQWDDLASIDHASRHERLVPEYKVSVSRSLLPARALYKLDGPDARPSVTTICSASQMKCCGMWGPFEQHLFVVSANPGGKLFKVALSEKGSNTQLHPQAICHWEFVVRLVRRWEVALGVGTQGRSCRSI